MLPRKKKNAPKEKKKMLPRNHTMLTPSFAHFLAHSLVLLDYMYATAGRVFEVK